MLRVVPEAAGQVREPEEGEPVGAMVAASEAAARSPALVQVAMEEVCLEDRLDPGQGAAISVVNLVGRQAVAGWAWVNLVESKAGPGVAVDWVAAHPQQRR